MEKIKFVTDSASDITLDEEKRYGIRVMNYKITLGDKGYVSRIDISNREFYDLLGRNPELPKTSQIYVHEFVELYEELYNDGYTHVLMTLINREATATVSNAEAAAEAFYADHPDAAKLMQIKIIDSRTYCCGYGYPVIEGVKMADRGVAFDDIVIFIENWLRHLVIYFAPYTLKYAKKSGRIPSALAVTGEALGIKPIMRIYNSKIETAGTVRGEKKIIQKLVECADKEIIRGTPYITGCGQNYEDILTLNRELTMKIGYPPVKSLDLGPIITAHAGPKVLGFAIQSRFTK